VEKWGIKLNRVKKFLKGWGMNIRGHSEKIKAILQEELTLLEKEEENSPLPAHLLNRKTFIQTTLLRMLEEEELYWHKRSNLNWLLQGGNNTEFFHRIANGKKRKNLIFNLEHEGNILEKDEDILTHATNYYRVIWTLGKSSFSFRPQLLGT
jgi:hypothetical protein